MRHERKDFALELIDEPLQSHVVAWEQAARALNNEDAKPILNKIMSDLREIRVTDNNNVRLISAFHVISTALEQVTEILNNNEALTLSKHQGVMVKAAIQAGWIISPLLTMDKVDSMKPWLVTWIADRVRALYLDATTIPKN